MNRRKVLRIPGYDYSTPGSCFITICASDRRDRFGSMREGVPVPTAAGHMLVAQWLDLSEGFPDVTVGEFIAMPDHIHGILWLGMKQEDVGSTSVGRAIQAYKSLTTREYSIGVRTLGWTPFEGRLWQPNYYEHIIRSDSSLDRHRAYIASNPSRRWIKRGS